MLPITIQEIGNTIRKRRKILKITQEQLASVSNVALRTLREVEQGSGNPSFETLANLLDSLGLEIKVSIKNKG